MTTEVKDFKKNDNIGTFITLQGNDIFDIHKQIKDINSEHS